MLITAPAAAETLLLSGISIDEPIRIASWQLLSEVTSIGNVFVQTIPMLTSIAAVYLFYRFFSLPKVILLSSLALPAVVLAILLSLPESLYGWIVIIIGLALCVGVLLAAQVQVQVCSHVSPEELRPVLASMLTVMAIGIGLAELAPMAGPLLLPLELIGLSNGMHLMMWWPHHSIYILGIIASLVTVVAAFWERSRKGSMHLPRNLSSKRSASDQGWQLHSPRRLMDSVSIRPMPWLGPSQCRPEHERPQAQVVAGLLQYDGERPMPA